LPQKGTKDTKTDWDCRGAACCASTAILFFRFVSFVPLCGHFVLLPELRHLRFLWLFLPLIFLVITA